MLPNNKGFTLVELMITVAIIAILSTLAITNYSRHIKKTSCTDALSQMYDIGRNLSRFKLINGTYKDAGLDNPNIGDSSASDQTTLNFPYGCAGTKCTYQISRSDPAKATYWVLEADPISGSSADGNQSLILNSSGQQGNVLPLSATSIITCP